MISKLAAMLPKAPEYTYCWSEIESCFIGSLLRNMTQVKQNCEHHAEGDVWVHTKMVCDCLCAMDEFRALAPLEQAVVSLAALLHDVGKISSTRYENGEFISPGHSLSGANLVREILWKYFGLSGKSEYIAFREAVAMIIRYHSTPVYIQNHIEPDKRLIKIASNGELTKLFSIRLVCLLAKANIMGRICEKRQEFLGRIEECRSMAIQCGCYESPRRFESDREYRAFTNPKSAIFTKSQARVIMLCGLPGSGKDAWIQKNCAELAVISMDNVRKMLKLKPSEKSADVSRAAQDQARMYLRTGTSLVWNATNLAETTRMRLIRFFEMQGAAVQIVYLEKEWCDTLEQNEKREKSVPVHVLEEMLSKLTPPERFEAESVIWAVE